MSCISHFVLDFHEAGLQVETFKIGAGMERGVM